MRQIFTLRAMSLPPNLRPTVFQAKSSLPGSVFPLLPESFWVADGGLVIVIFSEMEVREENKVEKAALKDGWVPLWHFSLAKWITT